MEEKMKKKSEREREGEKENEAFFSMYLVWLLMHNSSPIGHDYDLDGRFAWVTFTLKKWTNVCVQTSHWMHTLSSTSIDQSFLVANRSFGDFDFAIDNDIKNNWQIDKESARFDQNQCIFHLQTHTHTHTHTHIHKELIIIRKKPSSTQEWIVFLLVEDFLYTCLSWSM